MLGRFSILWGEHRSASGGLTVVGSPQIGGMGHKNIEIALKPDVKKRKNAFKPEIRKILAELLRNLEERGTKMQKIL